MEGIAVIFELFVIELAAFTIKDHLLLFLCQMILIVRLSVFLK